MLAVISVVMVLACHLMAGETGIRVAKRVDFNDPRGGKGACDCEAAKVKAHIQHYVNEDHNAWEFHDAMLSHRSINSVGGSCQQFLSSEPAGNWI